MEPFVTRDFVEPIMGFIATCPFLDKYHIDLSPAGVQKIPTSRPNASALESIGSVRISDSKDVLRNQRCNRQANFNLWLLRSARHNVQRKETTDFLLNFEQWVEHSQFAGECPKFSTDKQDQDREDMWADNGIYFSEWEDGSDANLYLMQLHISYFNSYQNKEDLSWP